jgi:hypothetical protein
MTEKNDLDKNPHYVNGKYWGNQTAKFIENTKYGTLDKAIEVKKVLLQDFEESFQWNMENETYAETKGFLDALISARDEGGGT